MPQPIISMSPDGKQEYCCNVIRVGTLEPIEGSDFLAKTYINGDSIVVRKDQISEGDIFLYASNECALSKAFLAANNLFEIGAAELNSNADEVLPILKISAKLKDEIDVGDVIVKKLSRARRFLESLQNQVVSRKKAWMMINGELSKLNLAPSEDMAEEDRDKALMVNILNKIKEYNEAKETLSKRREELAAEAKAKVGFFNKHGRVRCIRLKGVPSYGFIFSKNEMVKAFPEFADINLEEHLGEDFDTVCGELFVKAYVPPVQHSPQRSGSGKGRDYAQKRADSFDRMVPGEFLFHYDTQPLGKNMWKLDPSDIVTITVKAHGSSGIFANIKTKYPIKLNIFKKMINWVSKLTVKKPVFDEYYVDYGNVYSSRKVIKNKGINPNKGSDYYSSDIWGHWAQILNPFIPKDMTVYGEICGYTPDGKFIQDKYDYGCQPGESKFMPYRISVHDTETDIRTEWDIEDVYNWTVSLLNEHPELQGKIMPIDILYHGKFVNLYPDIKADNNWHDNVLHTMAGDSVTFGMEELEPLCANPVPREGLVIRKDGDKCPEAFKLKTDCFREFERKQVDAGIIDSEMAENFGEDTPPEEN